MRAEGEKRTQARRGARGDNLDVEDEVDDKSKTVDPAGDMVADDAAGGGDSESRRVVE